MSLLSVFGREGGIKLVCAVARIVSSIDNRRLVGTGCASDYGSACGTSNSTNTFVPPVG